MSNRRTRTVILDDHFPTLSSGFRVAEFTELMRAGLVSEVLTTMGPFDEILKPFAKAYPEFAERVRRYSPQRLGQYERAYLLFLNNANYYLEAMEDADLPFVLTLFPGGGLDDSDECRSKLNRVLGSSLLEHVFTTQPRVAELVGRNFPDVAQTRLTGLFASPGYFVPGAGRRENYFESGKDTLDLCFVAHKYTMTGADKGFPVFVETISELRSRGVPAKGHVVGEFTKADVCMFGDGAHVATYGVLDSSHLREFYGRMDAILSPNVPGLLSEGAFDGFPLGSCVEAALCGAAMIASDELHQNEFLRDGRDALLVPPSSEAIVERLIKLLGEQDGIKRVARSGLRAVRYIYAPGRQLDLRVPVLAREPSNRMRHS